LVRTRNGGLYWPQYIRADENPFCTGNITCSGLWDWEQSPVVLGALRGSYVHKTTFDSGNRWHYFTASSSSTPDYFVTYIRILSGKAPDGIALMFEEQPDINGFCTGG